MLTSINTRRNQLLYRPCVKTGRCPCSYYGCCALWYPVHSHQGYELTGRGRNYLLTKTMWAQFYKAFVFIFKGRKWITQVCIAFNSTVLNYKAISHVYHFHHCLGYGYYYFDWAPRLKATLEEMGLFVLWFHILDHWWKSGQEPKDSRNV